MNKCTIFAGGKIDDDLSYIDIDSIKDTYIISADKGLLFANKLGLKTDLIIGDCDSLGYVPENAALYPTKKDDTDLMLAVKEALNKGYTDIDIYGGFGGRFDHLFGNIQALAYIAKHGSIGRLVSAADVVTVLNPGAYSFEKVNGFSLSLFAYTDTVEGLSLNGTEYTASNIILTNAFPLGVSNVITDNSAKITFESGKLIVIQSKLN
ncbi:MAG: thiamine diphosphokinase [Ruminococcus sp.]|nr:thiamine diphosphokinase [Ruminococcus sp.]